MKISILNSYNLDPATPLETSGRNIGNSYICYCLTKLVEDSGHEVVFDDYSNHNDLYLLNCQDNLCKGKESPLLLKVDYSQVRILGLGINNWFHDQKISFEPVAYRNLIKASLECPISVRGLFTQAHLKKMSIKSIVHGCPSFYLHERLSISTLDCMPDENEIVVGGDFGYFRNPRGFFSQGDYDIRVAKFLLKHSRCVEGVYHYLNTKERSIKPPSEICAQHSFYVTNFSNLRDIFKDYKLYVGSRVHGCIMALSSGIPAICTNYDFRAIEMCLSMGIPHFAFLPQFKDNYFVGALNREIAALVSSYPEKRDSFRKYFSNILVGKS